MSRDYAGRGKAGELGQGDEALSSPQEFLNEHKSSVFSCAVIKVLAGVLFISLLMALCS